MTENQVPFRGVPFPVTGGRVLIFPAMSLGTVEDYEDRINEFLQGKCEKPVKLIVEMVTLTFQRNYPDVTEADVRGWLDADNIQDLFTALLKRSGYRREDGSPGNPVAGVESLGTGALSTQSLQPASEAAGGSITSAGTSPSPTTSISSGTGSDSPPFTSPLPPTSVSATEGGALPLLSLDNLPGG